MSTDPFVLDTPIIHVWKFDWSVWPEALLASMSAWLFAEEHQQANRYKIPEDRGRFCVGRAMLRYLSGCYLRCDGKALQLEVNHYGKPRWQGFHEQLGFNISHSGDWVLIAFTAGLDVGIDVERVNQSPRFDFLTVAKHAFHPLEMAQLDAMPEEQKKSTFYDLWSCKEAVMKAIGTGFHGVLNQCSVLPLPVQEKWSLIDGAAWNLAVKEIMVKKVTIDSAHVGAIAIQGCAAQPEIKQWRLVDSGLIPMTHKINILP